MSLFRLAARSARESQTGQRATITTQRGNLFGLKQQPGAWAMRDRVDDPPIVRCPGCNQPMEAKERTPVMERSRLNPPLALVGNRTLPT
jgi:hypothetical protein